MPPTKKGWEMRTNLNLDNEMSIFCNSKREWEREIERKCERSIHFKSSIKTASRRRRHKKLQRLITKKSEKPARKIQKMESLFFEVVMHNSASSWPVCQQAKCPSGGHGRTGRSACQLVLPQVSISPSFYIQFFPAQIPKAQ